MPLSPQRRMLLGFVLANGCIALVAVLLWSWRPTPPPLIQGVLLPEARPLEAFTLLDSQGREVGRESLQGHWTLVTYGFTTCPDVCPATLADLMQFRQRLPADYAHDLEILFYSVDYRRDSPERLRSYLGFFASDLRGLTASPTHVTGQQAFERSLGILAQLEPGDSGDLSTGDYQVLHGVSLLLLNPRGELQALLEPDPAGAGLPTFNINTLVQDYLALRDYFDQTTLAHATTRPRPG